MSDASDGDRWPCGQPHSLMTGYRRYASIDTGTIVRVTREVRLELEPHDGVRPIESVLIIPGTRLVYLASSYGWDDPFLPTHHLTDIDAPRRCLRWTAGIRSYPYGAPDRPWVDDPNGELAWASRDHLLAR